MSHVTQITVIEVPAKAQDDALAVMRDRAEFMARQAGFVAIRLYRSLDNDRIVNFVEWESRELLAAAHESPEFRKEWRRFDELTDSIDPHLYETFAEPQAKRAG